MPEETKLKLTEIIENSFKQVTTLKQWIELYDDWVEKYPDKLMNNPWYQTLTNKYKPGIKCKSCGIPIEWKVMPSGARNPLNLEVLEYDYRNPDKLKEQYKQSYGKEMNMEKLKGDPGNLQVVNSIGEIEKISKCITGKLSHYVSCPNAKEHKKTREKKTKSEVIVNSNKNISVFRNSNEQITLTWNDPGYKILMETDRIDPNVTIISFECIYCNHINKRPLVLNNKVYNFGCSNCEKTLFELVPNA